MQLQLTPVALDQLGEGIPVAGLRPGDKIGFDENPPIRVLQPCLTAWLPV